MCSAPIWAVTMASLLLPALAHSQPVQYPGTPGTHPFVDVCTAAGQAGRVTSGSTPTAVGTGVLFANGPAGSIFNDCVVGPDGWLYIASQSEIQKVDLPATSLPAATQLVVGLPKVQGNQWLARGLAFNVNTLYVTTNLGVSRYNLSEGVKPELPVSSGGIGIAFDFAGNLNIVSGTSILQAAGTPYVNAYGTPSALSSESAPEDPITIEGAYGIGMNRPAGSSSSGRQRPRQSIGSLPAAL